MKDSILIDGICYIPESTRPTGNREVVVCERGWIFVGDVTERTADGYLDIANAANLRKWGKTGFGGALTDPKGAEVQLDPCPPLSVRLAAVLTRHPVGEEWNR